MVTLPTIQKATLKALAEACKYSLGAHPPREAVTGKFPRHLRGDVKKALRKLRAKGYCMEHPTGRNTTYQLTRQGLAIARSF